MRPQHHWPGVPDIVLRDLPELHCRLEALHSDLSEGDRHEIAHETRMDSGDTSAAE